MAVNVTYGRMRQLPPSRVGGWAARTGAVALAIACLVAAAPAGATGATGSTGSAGSTEHNVTVNGKPIYTPTGITVQKGDTLTITATGAISFGGGQIANLGPQGIPWGEQCDKIANPHQRRFPWPLRGAPCWSLLGRIGREQAIEIGPSKRFAADRNGELLLGVNDNFVRDNTGSWDAKVTVTPEGVTPPAPSSSSSSGGGSSALIFVLLGVVLLIALGLLLFFLRRRRKNEPGDGNAEPAPAWPPAPVAAPVAAGAAAAASDAAPEPEPAPAAPAIPMAPNDPESIDVNIFDVEFTNGLQLRVGYNHFPDGTPVNWRVMQSNKPVAVGSFVAVGGGSINHFETMPLGVKLTGRDSEPDGADVQFDWNINGVPFRYSVRRDPNC